MAEQPVTEASSATSSIYKPLTAARKEFRLLQLERGERNDRIRCTLHHSQLETAPFPEYETISYCRGDAAIRDSISVNDISVSVPASSAAALRRVRLRDRSRLVWVDAICINQGDDDERSSQVSLMRDLYSIGIRNLVYLGEQDMTEAIRNVQIILEDLGTDELFAQWATFKSADEFRNRFYQKSKHRYLAPEFDDRALDDLFSIEWFWRVWTFQEAILPRESICLLGPSDIPLLDLARCAASIASNESFQGNHASSMSAAPLAVMFNYIDPMCRDIFRIDKGPRAMLECLRLLGAKRCSLPVDRVYGMLGLFPGTGIMADYRQSAAVMLPKVAQLLVAGERSLSLLQLATKSLAYQNGRWRKLAASEDLPSWVPPWHACVEMSTSVLYNASYRACKDRRYDASLQIAGTPVTVLRAAGIGVGRVRKLAESIDFDAETGQFSSLNATSSTLSSLEQLASEAIASRIIQVPDPAWEGFSQAEIELITIIERILSHRRKLAPPRALVDSRRAYKTLINARGSVRFTTGLGFNESSTVDLKAEFHRRFTHTFLIQTENL